MKLLVANRGEIAVRVLRAACELGIETVALASEDDATSPHLCAADASYQLGGTGPAAYLDAAAIIAAAKECGCDAIHPGYGFLSESADFARRCAQAGITFVGPRAETLEVLGDKPAARRLAEGLGVPVLPGASDPDSARALLHSLGSGGALMLKAAAGGGGRGMRRIETVEELDAAWQRCVSEARAGFAGGEVYAERWLPQARHIEVQIIADDAGSTRHLFERECSLQRRQQKLVEIAPSPAVSPALRESLTSAALRMARELSYRSLGTFEFLLAGGSEEREAQWFFLEANPRLQVEHTVTEEISGIDLVRAQLRIAEGASLGELGLGEDAVIETRGYAVEARVNTESVSDTGELHPAGGTLSVYEPPSGPGIRVDGYMRAGATTNPRFDSLLAKVIAHDPDRDFERTVRRLQRALREFRVEGVATNLTFLRALLAHPDVIANRVSTGFVESNMAELASAARAHDDAMAGSAAGAACADAETRAGSLTGAARDHDDTTAGSVAGAAGVGDNATVGNVAGTVRAGDNATVGNVAGVARSYDTATAGNLAGAKVASDDPLAVLDHGKTGGSATVAAPPEPPLAGISKQGPAGTSAVLARLQGTIVSLDVEVGDSVVAGRPLLVMEAMKMEHVVAADCSGIVRAFGVGVGDTVFEGHALLFIDPSEVEGGVEDIVGEVDIDTIRPDLAELNERHGFGYDAARPEAVARRRKTGQRTVRENVDDLCDPDSFVEYGALVIAAQRARRSVDELMRATPGDGLVAGLATVNVQLFGEEAARCVVMSYDYAVLAGTQGQQNHRKKDRMFELAGRWRIPLLIFTEGGGGRPGDTETLSIAGLDCHAFHYFGRLSGLVPLVAINSGRCFAGNAALFGCCDVTIATENSTIGMGGPAMIEGGGLGVFRPEEVGPIEVHKRNGVVDIVVADEAEAVAVAKRYLSYFQGKLSHWDCADQRLLRHAIPENRLRVYDVRKVVEQLCDSGSVLELRRHFGPGMLTALARMEGRPLGIIANNPLHLGGAIDSDGADKAARFMKLCDAFDIPILFLCDTPGIMVGPEAEKSGTVRHAARMFVVGANLSVPFFTVVLRKGYGLGAQAMAGGSFRAPLFTVSWPTGEFGGMGLEGAVKLALRKELAAEKDPEKRKAFFDQVVAHLYEQGRAVNAATYFEFDDVIDPADTRRHIMRALHSAAPPATPGREKEKKRPCIDVW